MGFIAKILSVTTNALRNEFEFTELKVDPSKGAVVTTPQIGPPGEDSPALPGDFMVGVPVQRTGNHVAVGVYDPANPGQAAPGEVRRYARDLTGRIVATVWLRNSGAVEVSNDAGSVTLGADGSVRLANTAGSVELGADGGVQAATPAGSFGMDAAGRLAATVTSLDIGDGIGSMSLAGGLWTINGVTIDPAGLVTATDFATALITLITHLHLSADPPSDVGPAK